MGKPCAMCAQTDALYRCPSCPKPCAPVVTLDDVASDASLPTLDDACGALLFDERDFDLGSLNAPLEALFTRPSPTLEWDAVLGGLPTLPSEPVRRVKSEPVLGVGVGTTPRDPPSPLSSVTEGSQSAHSGVTAHSGCEPQSPIMMPVNVEMPLSAPPAPMSVTVPMQMQVLRPTVSACSSTSALPSIGDTPTEEQRREARAKALARFRSKRASRSFAKRVRYECRKQLADSRPRVKGRFVKKSEMALYRKYGDLYRNFLHEIAES